MKTYIAEWLILSISILLVFSPFIYLGVKKWKRHLSVNWWQVILAYILSVLFFYVFDWVILGKLDKLIYSNYQELGWIQDAITDAGSHMIIIVIIVWPLLVFYCTKLVKEKLTVLNFVLSLLFALLMFGWLVALYIHFLMKALFEYF